MRYKVSCRKPDCHLYAAWYDSEALAKFVAEAHNHTNETHLAEVTDYQANPKPVESFKPDQTGTQIEAAP